MQNLGKILFLFFSQNCHKINQTALSIFAVFKLNDDVGQFFNIYNKQIHQMWNILIILLLTYATIVGVFYLRKNNQRGHKKAKKVAFFHPFCNDGGGGEKVLWSIIQSLLEECSPDAHAQQYETQPIINVYSLQSNTQEIFSKIHQRFNINLSHYAHRINIIPVSGRSLLVPQPYLTMLFHIFLPMIYCFKCLWKYQPDIFYDTTGFAFNFLLVKLLLPTTTCRAYVHYPFISDDMVSKIRERKTDFNNDAGISQSWWKTSLKLAYYNAILLLYKCLRFTVSKAEANSTWTYDHMSKIWGQNKMKKLYPPCSISNLLKKTKNYDEQIIKIVSLAQFRPQKNHQLQIKTINHLVKEKNIKNIRLSICGTTRGPGDEAILKDLQEKVQILELKQYIQFCVNFKFPDLLKKLEESICGIHTMQAQHFGISIVEMLAGGMLVLAHNSAGPRYDIIKDEQYLASSQEQYFTKMEKIIKMKQKKSKSDDFRKQMHKFSEQQFKSNFRQVFYA